GAGRAAALRAAGGVLVGVEDGGDEGRVDLAGGLRALGARGLTRVLVEGGGRLAAGLLRAGLVDRVAWFHAPGVVGGDGVAAVAGMGLERIAGMARFTVVSRRVAGADWLTEMVPAGVGGAG
ncbi:MAG: RibD family protein, partial [Janthinobacterium lividum]